MSLSNTAQQQNNVAQSAARHRRSSLNGGTFSLQPLAYAVGLMLLSASVQAAEPRPFSGGWFNAKNVGQAGGAQGARPGINLPGTPPPL
ncbi:TPA: hypothetical protein ACIIVN_005512, partial [Klebsiella pneumoniae]